MSETETAPAAPADAGQANGKPRAPRVTAPKPEAEAVILEGKPVDEDCENCGEGEPGKAAAGLGLLICAVAGGLLYIGIDLLTGGGLSRRIAGPPPEDER